MKEIFLLSLLLASMVLLDPEKQGFGVYSYNLKKLGSFAERFPDIAKEWYPIKNKKFEEQGFTPERLPVSSHTPAFSDPQSFALQNQPRLRSQRLSYSPAPLSRCLVFEPQRRLRLLPVLLSNWLEFNDDAYKAKRDRKLKHRHCLTKKERRYPSL